MNSGRHDFESHNDHAIYLFRYALQQSCWEEKPEERPTFAEIVNKLEQYLELIGEYVDISGLRSGNCTDQEDPAYDKATSPTGQYYSGTSSQSHQLALLNNYRMSP